MQTIQVFAVYSLKNGRGISKNWRSIVAKSNRPCTGILGVEAIEKAKREQGAYFEEYRLFNEKGKGYIFLEINHKCGICGHSKTVKEAVFKALQFEHITVFFTPQAGNNLAK